MRLPCGYTFKKIKVVKGYKVMKNKYEIGIILNGAIKQEHSNNTKQLINLALICSYCKKQHINLEDVFIRLNENNFQTKPHKTNIVGEMILGVNAYI